MTDTSVLTDQTKTMLLNWVIEANLKSTDLRSFQDDPSKFKEIQTYLNNKVKTGRDLKEWLKLIDNLDVVNPKVDQYLRLSLFITSYQ